MSLRRSGATEAISSCWDCFAHSHSLAMTFYIDICLCIELKNKAQIPGAGDALLLSVKGLDQFFGCLCFRCELDHQLSAADSDVFLIERIKSLLAFLADGDQPRVAQDRKVMGDCRLGNIELLHDLIHRERVTAHQFHDLLAGLIRDGFGKKDRVKFHIDNFLCVII